MWLLDCCLIRVWFQVATALSPSIHFNLDTFSRLFCCLSNCPLGNVLRVCVCSCLLLTTLGGSRKMRNVHWLGQKGL
jgi:hypothetical protein